MKEALINEYIKYRDDIIYFISTACKVSLTENEKTFLCSVVNNDKIAISDHILRYKGTHLYIMLNDVLFNSNRKWFIFTNNKNSKRKIYNRLYNLIINIQHISPIKMINNRVIKFENGSSIFLMTYKSSGDGFALRGHTINGLILDELDMQTKPDDIIPNVWYILRPSDSKVIVTYTENNKDKISSLTENCDIKYL